MSYKLLVLETELSRAIERRDQAEAIQRIHRWNSTEKEQAARRQRTFYWRTQPNSTDCARRKSGARKAHERELRGGTATTA